MLGKGVQRMLLLAMFMFVASFADESPPQGMTRGDAANKSKQDSSPGMEAVSTEGEGHEEENGAGDGKDGESSEAGQDEEEGEEEGAEGDEVHAGGKSMMEEGEESEEGEEDDEDEEGEEGEARASMLEEGEESEEGEEDNEDEDGEEGEEQDEDGEKRSASLLDLGEEDQDAGDEEKEDDEEGEEGEADEGAEADFAKADADKSSFLEEKEVEGSLKMLLQGEVPASVQWRSYDQDKDGKLNITEYEELADHTSQVQRFGGLDKSKSSFLEEEELRASALEGLTAGAKSVVEGWRVFDDNKDGKLGLEEFKKMDAKVGEAEESAEGEEQDGDGE